MPIINEFLSTTRALPLLLALLLVACGDSSDRVQSGSVEPEPEPEPEPTASARVAVQGDLLSGPLARGVEGDFVLENDYLRVIIQQPGRQWLSVGTYGGNIIDVSRKTEAGATLPDHLEEFVLGLNIENTPNYTEVRVESDGSNGEPAVVCATGPDDLLELANASSTVGSFGVPLPASADDRDLPVEIETCYSLAVDAQYVVIDTVLRNTGGEPFDVYMVEYLNGSGQVEFFQPYAGFGEPTLTPACPVETNIACDAFDDALCDQCNFVAYGGVDGANEVSYGLIHGEAGSSSFSQVGINIVVYGDAALNLLVGLVPPNYTVPVDEPLQLRRYFAVGDGTVASIADIRNELFGIQTAAVGGVVSSGGEPLENARIAVFQTLDAQSEPPELFMITHTRTNETGRYQLNLPPGEYQLAVSKEGYRQAEQGVQQLSVDADAIDGLDFTLPASGYLEVTVIDEIGPGPAKLQLVGFDPSPTPTNALDSAISIFRTGVFGDPGADGLPFGIVQAAFIDRQGVSERITVEPGTYQLVVSRGPRYSVFKRDITISAGQVTTVQAEIVKLVDDGGFVHGDFHVHSIDSPDSEVTRAERVAVMLAEGLDFFTPSDHGVRADFSPTLKAMGVEDLIGVAASSETTTFDYGHFNSWPVSVDPGSISGGSFDWAGAASPGMDFPAYGSFSLSPDEIIAGLLADPMENIVQINHIGSHFGSSGLAIDTGLTPPQSSADLSSKRLNPDLGNAFSDRFDALEVWIGDGGRNAILSTFLGENAGDWFNLINQGIVRIAIANSDTHDRRFSKVSARTLIANATVNPPEVAADAEGLAENVLAGKVIGTNAPLLLLQADGQFNGSAQQAGLRLEQNTTMPVDALSTITLTATITTPAWAPVDKVDFYINNQPERTTGPSSAARYNVCPNASVSAGDPGWQAVDVVVNDRVTGATRTDITATLTLENVARDTWVVATVSGTDGISAPLFPVLPSSLEPGTNTTLQDLTDGNVGELGVPAFAFTNPLFIDVDGNGWTPPGVANAPCTDSGPAVTEAAP